MPCFFVKKYFYQHSIFIILLLRDVRKGMRRMRRRIDYDKIIAQADSELVFRSIGIDVVNHGRVKQILCPGHLKTLGRHDRKLGSCIVTPNGCYCYSCGQGYNIIRAASDYLDIDMSKAAHVVAEICGIDAIYGQEIVNKSEFRYRALTKDEMRLLGLCTNERKSAYAVQGIVYDYEVDDISENIVLSKETYEDAEGGLYHLILNSIPMSMSMLIADNKLSCNDIKEEENEEVDNDDDRNVYQWLVQNKIKESYWKYQKLKKKLENPLKNKEFYSFLYEVRLSAIGLLSAVMDALFTLKNLYSEFDGDISELDELSEEYFVQYYKNEKDEC